jgi:riboflavin kinase/FMN adenylyltransferase
MRLIRQSRDLPDDAQAGVIAIGNFDGVHRGHAAVIAATHDLARKLNAPCGVLTFEPHPRSFFRPDDPPFRLTPLPEKALALEALGVDFLVAVSFDQALSELTALDFVDQILRRDLKARHVVVGYDFVFGKDRGGNVDVLKGVAEQNGFGITVVDAAADDSGLVFSASAIRDALHAARPLDAATLLGRPWMIEGIVQTGEKRGTQIGFPTANLDLGEHLVPKLGVYAVQARRESDQEALLGVANLGRRPTFGGEGVVLEVHLFDFSEDLYGMTLRAELIEFLRPETKFDGIDSLRTQIALDCDEARAVHGASSA